MRLSKSSVNTYIQCPYKFKLQMVDKIEVPKGFALQRGCEIHEIAENFFKFDTIDAAKEQLSKHPKFQEYSKPISHLQNFVLNMNKDIFIKPKFSEMKLYNAELDFSGIVDAVFEDKGDILVLDWKTGHTHNLSDYRFELSMYHYLLEKEKNISCTHWGIFFLDHGELKVEEVNKIIIAASLDKVKEVRTLINSGKFEKRPSALCKFCDFFNAGVCNGRE